MLNFSLTAEHAEVAELFSSTSPLRSLRSRRLIPEILYADRLPSRHGQVKKSPPFHHTFLATFFPPLRPISPTRSRRNPLRTTANTYPGSPERGTYEILSAAQFSICKSSTTPRMRLSLSLLTRVIFRVTACATIHRSFSSTPNSSPLIGSVS